MAEPLSDRRWRVASWSCALCARCSRCGGRGARRRRRRVAREGRRAGGRSPGKYPRAVALLARPGGAPARDPSPDVSARRGYTLAGQYEEAIAEYRRFAARPEADPARKARAEAEADAARGGAGAVRRAAVPPAPATDEAKRLFDEGKKDAQAKKLRRRDRRATGGAAARSRSARSLSPARRGLRQDRRPRAGAAVPRRLPARAARRQDRRHRARAAAKEHVLGTLTVDASSPAEVYINGRETGQDDAAQGASRCRAGKYIVGLENEQYHIVAQPARRRHAGQGHRQEVHLRRAVSTKLDPWARVRVDGKDVGLWDEVGHPGRQAHRRLQEPRRRARRRPVEIDDQGRRAGRS